MDEDIQLIAQGKNWLSQHLLDSDRDIQDTNIDEIMTIVIFSSIDRYFGDAYFLFKNERFDSQGILCRSIYEATLQIWWLCLPDRHTHALELVIDDIQHTFDNAYALQNTIREAAQSQYFSQVESLSQPIEELKETLKDFRDKYLSHAKKKYVKEKNKLKLIRENSKKIDDDLYVNLTRVYQDCCADSHIAILPMLNKVLGKEREFSPSDAYMLSKLLYKSATEAICRRFPIK